MSRTGPSRGFRLGGSHLAHLHTFLAAARHHSFLRAADELCLTASAVSHRMARLEHDLGLQLFDRLPRGVRLTEDGERIFQVMQSAVDDLEGALQERGQGQIAGPLSFYVRPSVAQSWLVPRLAGFHERHPDVQLDVRVGNERIDYRTRNVDLVLSYSRGEFPGLVSTRLMPERIAPVCSPAYARRHGLAGNPAALSRCTLLHDVEAWDDAAFDAEWRLWAGQAGALGHLPARFLTFDRSDLCALAARHGAGIAIGREQLVRAQVERGELVTPLGGFLDPGGHAYYLAHPPRMPMPRRLQALIDWLHECAAGPAPEPGRPSGRAPPANRPAGDRPGRGRA
jgi:LysR family D-serine deaminase transcriptional activator